MSLISVVCITLGRRGGGYCRTLNRAQSRNRIGYDFLHRYFSYPIFIGKVLSVLIFFFFFFKLGGSRTCPSQNLPASRLPGRSAHALAHSQALIPPACISMHSSVISVPSTLLNLVCHFQALNCQIQELFSACISLTLSGSRS